MMALEDVRRIRHLLAWSALMCESDIQNWNNIQNYIRNYIQNFNIFSVAALTKHLVDLYRKQNSEIHVVSLEDDPHERIACQVLSPKEFVKKIENTFQTKDTVYQISKCGV